MDNIQIFTLGGTDRERHVINTVIQDALDQSGYSNVAMRDHEGAQQSPMPHVGSVLDAMRDFDPSMLSKEVVVHSVPCMFSKADEATIAMERASELFESFDGTTYMLAGSGQDEDGDVKITGVVLIEEGPTTRKERLKLEAITKDVAESTLARIVASHSAGKQNLHLVKPVEPPKEKE